MKLNLQHNFFQATVCVVLLSLLSMSNTYAADKKDKAARRAAQMMQQMQQQLEQEKATMQTQFDSQKKELQDKVTKSDDDIKKSNGSLAAAKHKATVLEGDLKKTNGEKVALETKLAAIQASLGSTQQNLDHLTEQYKQAQSDLKVNDTQRKTLVNNVSKTSKALSSCEVKNIKLHEFGSALVHIYDKPSTYEAVLRTEPFAQTKRVELENIMQDYQDKLDEQRAVSATDIK